MRKLASELGVEAMTLYYYFPNKDAILDGLVEASLMDSSGPVDAAPQSWANALRSYARGFRDSLRRRPNLLPLIATRPVRTPDSLAAIERSIAAWCAQGLSPLAAVQAMNIVTTFVIGHTVAEVGAPQNGDNAQDLDRLTATLDLASLPLLGQAMQAGLGQPAEQQARFELGLEALLKGLALLLPTHS